MASAILATLPSAPALDETLVRHAEALATGALNHRAAELGAHYREAVLQARRQAEFISDFGEEDGDRDELTRRVEAAVDAERELRRFVANQRCAAAGWIRRSRYAS